MAQAYGLAVECRAQSPLARKVVQSGPPWVKRLGIAVPYAAVVGAGAAFVAFTRLPEMRGVPVTSQR